LLIITIFLFFRLIARLKFDSLFIMFEIILHIYRFEKNLKLRNLGIQLSFLFIIPFFVGNPDGKAKFVFKWFKWLVI